MNNQVTLEKVIKKEVKLKPSKIDMSLSTGVSAMTGYLSSLIASYWNNFYNSHLEPVNNKMMPPMTPLPNPIAMGVIGSLITQAGLLYVIESRISKNKRVKEEIGMINELLNNNVNEISVKYNSLKHFLNDKLPLSYKFGKIKLFREGDELYLTKNGNKVIKINYK